MKNATWENRRKLGSVPLRVFQSVTSTVMSGCVLKMQHHFSSTIEYIQFFSLDQQMEMHNGSRCRQKRRDFSEIGLTTSIGKCVFHHVKGRG
ncbi:hypothetical protein ACHQM5_027303 [Ranunculus cassubicifolius]